MEKLLFILFGIKPKQKSSLEFEVTKDGYLKRKNNSYEKICKNMFVYKSTN